MKQKIRENTFETNSSSTHTLVMCSEEDYKKFENNEVYYVDWITTEIRKELPKEYKNKEFIPKDIVDEVLEKLEIDDREEYFKTAEEFFDNEYLESFEQSYTTPNGETVVAFGLYGYDG